RAATAAARSPIARCCRRVACCPLRRLATNVHVSCGPGERCVRRCEPVSAEPAPSWTSGPRWPAARTGNQTPETTMNMFKRNRITQGLMAALLLTGSFALHAQQGFDQAPTWSQQPQQQGQAQGGQMPPQYPPGGMGG